MSLETLGTIATVLFVVLLGAALALSIWAMTVQMRQESSHPEKAERLQVHHDRLQHVSWIIAYLTAAAFVVALLARVLGAV
jgi:hypothetical protein